jgi:hypothetical protein
MRGWVDVTVSNADNGQLICCSSISAGGGVYCPLKRHLCLDSGVGFDDDLRSASPAQSDYCGPSNWTYEVCVTRNGLLVPSGRDTGRLGL